MIEAENKTSATEQPKAAALSAVKALYLKQAGDIMMYNVVDNTVIADYYVICSARSSTHIKALADEVCYRLELEGVKELRVEGRDGGTWVLVDFGSVIVHIFSKDAREFYKLERLLNEETKEDLSEFLKNLDENN
ncbi:MAG: ribosome silencing factor [Ruminococcaceae bacterium]|nr:ribosome silencing factor [Oscillospiraceae bacterium]